MSEFTQGVCADGAAILKDGVMLTIEQIIELLRRGDALMGAGEEPVAWRYWNEKSKSWNETHSKLVAEAMGEGGRIVEPLYTHSAPAVVPKVPTSEFERGALTVIALIIRCHDAESLAFDMLNEMGLNGADCSELDEYDKRDLSQLIGYRGAKLRGLVRPAEPATQRKWTGPGELERSGYIDSAEPDGGAV